MFFFQYDAKYKRTSILGQIPNENTLWLQTPTSVLNKLALLTTDDEVESDGPDVIQTEQ